MSDFAINERNEIIYSSSFDDISWESLKSNYKIGELKMPYCNCNAVPKTSSNFNKFFAHHIDDCHTAPETIWHKKSKQMILDCLSKLQISGIEEKNGINWKADIYFEINDRKIAIEIQRSPQTLITYFSRQEKYKSSQVECYWLLHKLRFLTINKSIGKYKFKQGEVLPISPCLGDLPILYIDDHDYKLKGVGLINLSIEDFLLGIIQKKFIFDKYWKLL